MSGSDSSRQKNRCTSGVELWCSALAESRPRLYLALALTMMLLGYFFLFLFPLLVIEGAGVLVHELPNVKTVGHWLVVEVWFAIILFCLFISYQIFQLHFPRVPGMKMSKELAPDLYALIAEVRKYTGRPPIRNIVLTDQYELRIEESPRFGYPFLTSNTLVVGMPMLQTLSLEQFRGQLMRRFAQYAGGRFRMTHWIFRTRLLWNQYHVALQKSRRFGVMPLRLFFRFYAPLYERLTVPAARMDELVADSAVLEWQNDRDYFDTVKSSTIAEMFLETVFWRNVHQAALKNPQAVLNPFAKLDNISGHLKSKEFRQKCLKEAYDEGQDFTNATPALCVRMENICQSSLRGAPTIDETAAVACLGNARKNYVPLIDKLWRSTTFAKWKADYEQRQKDLQVAKKLSRKSQKQVLNFREILRYAQVAKRLRGDTMLQSVKKILKRNLRNVWPASLSRKMFQSKLKASQQANDIF
jgi:hypothetical protein